MQSFVITASYKVNDMSVTDAEFHVKSDSKQAAIAKVHHYADMNGLRNFKVVNSSSINESTEEMADVLNLRDYVKTKDSKGYQKFLKHLRDTKGVAHSTKVHQMANSIFLNKEETEE